MLNPEITFDRFLSSFVPGAVFVFGSFYLHRPLLLKYFPYISGYAGGQSGDTLSPEARILLFSIAAVCMGVIFDQPAALGARVLSRWLSASPANEDPLDLYPPEHQYWEEYCQKRAETAKGGTIFLCKTRSRGTVGNQDPPGQRNACLVRVLEPWSKTSRTT